MDVPWRKKKLNIDIESQQSFKTKSQHNETEEEDDDISSPRNIKTKSQYTRTISGFMIDQTSK